MGLRTAVQQAAKSLLLPDELLKALKGKLEPFQSTFLFASSLSDSGFENEKMLINSNSEQWW